MIAADSNNAGFAEDEAADAAVRATMHAKPNRSSNGGAVLDLGPTTTVLETTQPGQWHVVLCRAFNSAGPLVRFQRESHSRCNLVD